MRRFHRGISVSILTGLNFIVTVHTMRCPGMTWFRLPLFIWSMYATSIIFILGTPVVAITLTLVALERILGDRNFRSQPRRRSRPLPALVFWFLQPSAPFTS